MFFNTTTAILDTHYIGMWVTHNESFPTIEWSEGASIPTEKEFNSHLPEAVTTMATQSVQQDRAAAYPSIEDQLDKIYHDGIDAWKADIKAVKDEYPKP